MKLKFRIKILIETSLNAISSLDAKVIKSQINLEKEGHINDMLLQTS